VHPHIRICGYEAGAKDVKTTVELPDEFYRRAKVEAASRGRTLKDLVEEGLELVLETRAARARDPTSPC
jgi:hypothetical protein